MTSDAWRVLAIMLGIVALISSKGLQDLLVLLLTPFVVVYGWLLWSWLAIFSSIYTDHYSSFAITCIAVAIGGWSVAGLATWRARRQGR